MDLNKIINDAKAKELESLMPEEVNQDPDYLGELIALNEGKPITKMEFVKSDWYLILDLTQEKYDNGILMLFDPKRVFQYENTEWVHMSNHIDRVVGVPINRLRQFVYGDVENKYWWWKKSDWKPTRQLQQELF